MTKQQQRIVVQKREKEQVLEKRDKVAEEFLKEKKKSLKPFSVEELVQLERKLVRAFQMLDEMGYDSGEELRLTKRSGDEDGEDYEEYDEAVLSRPWSEYETWGLDRKKKGLGSIV